MKLVADSKGRLTSAELFPPGQPFSAERAADGSIRLMELVEKEVPVVKPVRTKEGFLMFPKGRRPGRVKIAAAIRADRDAR